MTTSTENIAIGVDLRGIGSLDDLKAALAATGTQIESVGRAMVTTNTKSKASTVIIEGMTKAHQKFQAVVRQGKKGLFVQSVSQTGLNTVKEVELGERLVRAFGGLKAGTSARDLKSIQDSLAGAAKAAYAIDPSRLGDLIRNIMSGATAFRAMNAEEQAAERGLRAFSLALDKSGENIEKKRLKNFYPSTLKDQLLTRLGGTTGFSQADLKGITGPLNAALNASLSINPTRFRQIFEAIRTNSPFKAFTKDGAIAEQAIRNFVVAYENAANRVKAKTLKDTLPVTLRNDLLAQLGGIKPGTNAAEIKNLQSALAGVTKFATKSVADGGVDPARLKAILTHVQATTAGFAALTPAEEKAELAARHLANTYKNELSPGLQQIKAFGLTAASAFKVLEISALHIIFSRLISGISASTEEAAKLQIKISEIRTITQAAERSSSAWGETLREVSDAFSLDVLDVAEGAYQAISNQVTNSAGAFRFLTKSAELAKVTVSSTADSVNLLSSVMKAYQFSLADVDHISATLFKTIELGRVRASEMANTLGNTSTLSAQLGVSFEELSASIATLTVKGIQFDTANTLIRNIMLKLLKPSEDFKNLLSEWGVASGEAAIQTFGFVGVLERLQSEYKKGGIAKLGEELRELRAIQGVVGLTSGNTFADFQSNLEAVGGTAAGAAEAFKQYQKAKEIALESHGFKVQKELNELKNTFTFGFGNEFLSNTVKLAGAAGGLANAMEGVVHAIQGVIRPIVVLGTGLSNVINLFGVFSTATGYLSSAITSGALGLALYSTVAFKLIPIIATMGTAFTATSTTVITATGLITVSTNRMAAAFAALGLTPQGAIIIAAGAALGILVNRFANANAEILAIEGKTQKQLEEASKHYLDISTEGSNQALRVFRLEYEEKTKIINSHFAVVRRQLDQQLKFALKPRDKNTEIEDRFPILKKVFDEKEGDTDVKTQEKQAKDLGGLIRQLAEDNIKITSKAAKITRQNLLESLPDRQQFIELNKELNQMQGEINNLFGKDKLTEATAKFKEMETIVESITHKKFKLFEDARKDLEKSVDLVKKLQSDLVDKKSERALAGLTGPKLIAEANRQVKVLQANARRAEATGDFESARKSLEKITDLREKVFSDQNKKNKGSHNQKLIDKSIQDQIDLEIRSQAQLNGQLAEESKFRKELAEFNTKAAENQIALNEKTAQSYAKQLELSHQLLDIIKAQEEATRKANDAFKAIIEQKAQLTKTLTDNNLEAVNSSKEVASIGALLSKIPNVSIFGDITDKTKQDVIRKQFAELIALREKYTETLKTGSDEEKKSANFNLRSKSETARRNLGDFLREKNVDPNKLDVGNEKLTTIFDRMRKQEEILRTSSEALVKAQQDIKEVDASLDANKHIIEGFSDLGKAAEKAAINQKAAAESNIRQYELQIEKVKELKNAIDSIQVIQIRQGFVPKIEGKASGGLIGGRFTNLTRDNRLAMVADGEMIVNAASTRRFYRELVQMNAGVAPRGYAQGGMVSNTNNSFNFTVNGSDSPEAAARATLNMFKREIQRGNFKW